MTLSVRNLTISRGGLPLLENVSFDVPAGEALILRGPNGVGKTSLLRTLAGLQDVEAGKIDADPDDLLYASHADGVKSQLTVVENLAFWAEVYGQTVLDDVYDQFELTELKSRLAGTLSAGQKRRLGLARLGVAGRQIWLLDEPTVSLDQVSVARFASFLQNKHLAAGGSALIATHIDLGLDAPTLDLAQYVAKTNPVGQDEAFL